MAPSKKSKTKQAIAASKTIACIRKPVPRRGELPSPPAAAVLRSGGGTTSS